MRVVAGLRHDAQRQPGVARQPLKFGVVLTAQHPQRHGQLAQLRRQIRLPPERGGFEHVGNRRAAVDRTRGDQRLAVHMAKLFEHRLLIPVSQDFGNQLTAKTRRPSRILLATIAALLFVLQPRIAALDDHPLQAVMAAVASVIHGDAPAERVAHQPITFNIAQLQGRGDLRADVVEAAAAHRHGIAVAGQIDGQRRPFRAARGDHPPFIVVAEQAVQPHQPRTPRFALLQNSRRQHHCTAICCTRYCRLSAPSLGDTCSSISVAPPRRQPCSTACCSWLQFSGRA